MLTRAAQSSTFLGIVAVWLAVFISLTSAAHYGHHNHLHSHHRRAELKDLGNYKKSNLNLHAHTYEKLFLWEAYSIFVQQEGGAAKQKVILPFMTKVKTDKTPVTPEYSNRHVDGFKATDEPLNYEEFMLRVRGLAAESGNLGITPPVSTDDLERANAELFKGKGKFKGPIKMSAVNPNLPSEDEDANSGRKGKGKKGKGGKGKGGGSTSTTPANEDEEEQDAKHTRFISTVIDKLDEIYNDVSKFNRGDTPSRYNRAKEIGDRMKKIRRAATENWLIGELSKDDGWNLQESYINDQKKTAYRSTVVMDNEATTGIPGVPKYQAINFPATYNANSAKINGKQLTSGADFKTWANDLGNPDSSSSGPEASKSNTNHWQEAEAWKKIAPDPCPNTE